MYGWIVLGVTLGLTAEVFGGWANIQIKYSHLLESKKSDPKPIYLRLRWWFAVMLYGGNTILNLCSFMFAPLNVLAPTSALTIVINAFLAKVYFGETLTQSGYFGSVLIIIGCILSVIFGSHGEATIDLALAESYATRPGFIAYSIFYWILIIIALICGRLVRAYVNIDEISNDSNENEIPVISTNNSLINNRFINSQKSRHSFRAFCYAFACSGLGTWVQLTGKDSGSLILDTFSGNNQFNYIGSWLIVIYAGILITANLFFISEMLRIFDAVLIVPLYETLLILSTILMDIMYTGALKHNDSSHILMFLFSVLICIIGMFILSWGQESQSYIHRADNVKILNNDNKLKNPLLSNIKPLIKKIPKKINCINYINDINNDNISETSPLILSQLNDKRLRYGSYNEYIQRI